MQLQDVKMWPPNQYTVWHCDWLGGSGSVAGEAWTSGQDPGRKDTLGKYISLP